MNVVTPILDHASARPNAPALITPNVVIRYGQLGSAIESAAARLIEAGIAPGDVVSISLNNSPLNFVLFFALARIGAVSTTNLADNPPKVAEALARELGCKAVCHGSTGHPIRGIRSLPVDQSWMRASAGARALPPVPLEEGSLWRIVWSSGTTGEPKPIPFTHGGTFARVSAKVAYWGAGPQDRVLPVMSINASFALTVCLTTLFAGGTVILGRAAGTEGLIDTVDRNAVTLLATSPFILSRLVTNSTVAGAMPTLARVLVGGGTMNESLRRAAQSFFQGSVHSTYGATEAGDVAIGDCAVLDREPDAVGRLVPAAEVEAVDAEDRPLPRGQTGTLRIRVAGMVDRYLGNPDLTARVFRNGWFYPGDVGCVTPDGIVRVVGRTDELMNFDGLKVSPASVESAIADAIPAAEVGVVKLDQAGRPPSLVVAVAGGGVVDEERVIKACRSKVSTKIEIHVVPVDAIPRNAMGKIVRRDLAARIGTAMAALRPA